MCFVHVYPFPSTGAFIQHVHWLEEFYLRSRTKKKKETLSTWTGISSDDELACNLFAKRTVRTHYIICSVTCKAAASGGTYCLCTLPGDWASHGLHCCPAGFWKINFPPKAMLPPAGPPVSLLWSPEPLLLALGRSVFLYVAGAEMLSAGFPVSSSVSASRWVTAL